ncbi:xanthine dehydrogenase accessory protein XdhC [Hoeflea marina]|uniref:xanthine dehydrogenase accessory protein XdhC n=1 Tax=Hoeflea marina TaxID=274592 RepID=UPI003CC9A415
MAAFRRFAADAGDDGVVLVRVEIARGSTPRDRGAFMAVSRTDSFGTIGGGRLELDAVAHARRILEGHEPVPLALPLGPAIGQCCGGHVTLGFERIGPDRSETVERLIEAEDRADPEVWLFGGGHVSRALVRALALLPLRTHVVESRAEELGRTPQGAARHLTPLPESLVANIAPGSSVIVLTHDHALDFLIVSAALERDDLAEIGMIGSDTKRATFESQYKREGGNAARLERLTCPIGLKIADKRPEVIAATVAAQIMASLAAYRAKPTGVPG